MPEKQLCGKCGHEIETVETDKEWSQFFGKTRVVHKGSGTNCLVEGCKCHKPEPQILCGNCGKPKGEHKKSFNGIPKFCNNGKYQSSGKLQEFELSSIEDVRVSQ